MKYLFIFFIFVNTTIAIAQKQVVCYQNVVVEENASVTGLVAVTAETFIPEQCYLGQMIDSKGRERGFSILTRQGSQVTFFFNARPGERLKLNFYAVRKTHKKAKPLSGVLQLVKRFNGRTIHSLPEFKKTWKQATYIGGRFVSRIFSGHNPFGPGKNYMFMYKGFLDINHTGDYFFYTASTDASFLLINRKLVCSWAGRHWVSHGLYGHYNGRVHLKKGIHKITYLHANNQGSCYAVAAYRLPSQKKLQVIPTSMFTPVLKAKVGGFRKGNKILPGFTWYVDNMLELAGKQMYQLKFTTTPDNKASWSFGDGTNGTGNASEHFYFEQMTYPVVMTSATGNMTQAVSASFQYSKSMITGKKAEALIEAALHQEETIGIQAEGYRFLANYILKIELKRVYNSFYKRLITNQNVISPNVVFNFFCKTVLQTLLRDEKYEHAADELKAHIGKLKKNQYTASARLAYAKLLFYCLRNDNDAQQKLDACSFAALDKKEQLEYLILKGDIALLNQGYENALEIYQKINSFVKKQGARNKLLSAGAIINVRNSVIRKQYQDAMTYLKQIENNQPDIRLNPELMLMKGVVFAKLGRPKRAVICYEKVLRLNPVRATAAAANLAVAEFFVEQKLAYKAKKYLKHILSDAPRSRQAVAARKMLTEIKKYE